MADQDLKDALSALAAGPETTPAGETSPRGPASSSAHPAVDALRAQFADAVLHHTVHAGDEHVVYI